MQILTAHEGIDGKNIVTEVKYNLGLLFTEARIHSSIWPTVMKLCMWVDLRTSITHVLLLMRMLIISLAYSALLIDQSHINTGWSKLCIFQQKRVTNLVISQHYLCFKCMEVNILDKCIIKITDLQKMWYHTRCAKPKPQ